MFSELVVQNLSRSSHHCPACGSFQPAEEVATRTQQYTVGGWWFLCAPCERRAASYLTILAGLHSPYN